MLLIKLCLVVLAMASQPTLKRVDTDEKDNFLRAVLTFDSPVNSSDISLEFINETIQLDIPGAIYPYKKMFTKVRDEKLKHIYTYHPKDHILRTRLIYREGNRAENYRHSVNLSHEGNKVFIDVYPPFSLASVLKDESAVPKISIVDEELKGAKVKGAIDELSSELASLKKEVKKEEPKDSKITKTVKKIKKAARNTNENPEASIPVLQNAKEDKVQNSNSVTRMIQGLAIVFILMAGVTFAFRKWYKKSSLPTKNTNIKVITQHHLGPKKSLAIIRVAGESILLGVTDHNISMIKSLSLIDDEVPEETPAQFNSTLNNLTFNEVDDEESGVAYTENEDVDDFVVQGLKPYQHDSDRDGVS